MYKELTKGNFREEFKNYGREHQFTYEGLNELYEYYEEVEADTGVSTKLDVISLCCEWVELDIQDIKETYADITTIDELREYTTVVEVEGTDRYLVYEF